LACPSTSCGFFASGRAYTPTLPSSGNTFDARKAAELDFDVNPAHLALYDHNLDNAGRGTAGDLDAKGLYNVFFKSNLALGSMEIAYGCATVTAGCPCCFTPFTQSGQSTPGPSSWLLVSAAAIGILLSRFRITRKKKN
jgi:hypothetical protein